MPHDNVKLVYGHLGWQSLWIGPSHIDQHVALVPWDCDGARDNARENAARLCLAWNAHDALVGVLQDLREYFDNLSDADHDGEKFVPNREMRLVQEIDEALAKAGTQPGTGEPSTWPAIKLTEKEM